MNFELDEFGLDEPLLDDVQGQNYASFLLDQPLDLFDDLNADESQESSLGSSNNQTIVNIDSLTQDSCNSSTSSHHHLLQLPVYRRDSSDESDVGIVDDILIQCPCPAQVPPAGNNVPHIVGTKRTINGEVPNQKFAFVQQPQVPTAVIKLEPLAPQTSQIPLTLAVVEDKPQIAPKPCLVISPNGALTPFSLQQASGKLVNVKDIKIQTPAQTPVSTVSSSKAGFSRQQQDEIERQAKRQMRIIKNREAATLSRQRQKAYLESLEERVRLLARENEQVKLENEEMKKLVERLHEENQGLRGGGGHHSGSGFSTSSSVGSPEDLSPVSLLQHDSPIFVSAAPSPPAQIVQPPPQPPQVVIKPQVIDLDDEPVPKKILIKPAVPIVTLPVSIVGAKHPVNLFPTATISRDTKGVSLIAPKIEKVQPQMQQQQPTIRRVFVAARPSAKILLVFSLIFAFNCIPFASKMFRESSTTTSPVAFSSSISELGYNAKNLPSPPQPPPQVSHILDGGRILYKVKRGASESHDLMVVPHRSSYFEFDVVDGSNNLPLMDESVLAGEDPRPNQKCEVPVNATQSQRIVNALSQWASLQRQKSEPSQVKPQTAPFTAEDQPRPLRRRVVSGSSGLQLYRRRNAAARQHESDQRVQVTSDEASSLAMYEKFAKTIRQRNDTFYMVSFHVDQLIFPALVVNRTTRPKMSLVLPALFSFNETVSPPDGSVALMQIECEINDMKIFHLGKHLVPLDIVLRHMRNDGAHADATSRMYRQWLYGKAATAP